MYANFELIEEGEALKISLLPDGRLLIDQLYTSQSQPRIGINEMLKHLIYPQLEGEWYVIAPENIGALTSAYPLLCKEVDFIPGCDDELVLIPIQDAYVYWNPDYQIQDEIEILLRDGYIVFTGVQIVKE